MQHLEKTQKATKKPEKPLKFIKNYQTKKVQKKH